MKKVIKNYVYWLFFWIWFLTIIGIWYFAIKARQTTNPGITDSDPSAIYTAAWETLTAAKRNTLVDNVVNNWEDGVVRVWNVQICWWEVDFSVSSSTYAVPVVTFLKPFKDTNYTLTASNMTNVSSSAFTVYSIGKTSTTQGKIWVIQIDAAAKTWSWKISRVAVWLWR